MALAPGNIASYNIAPGESQADVDLRRKYAMMLMQSGMSAEPVRHWAQGLARAVQSGMGGYELYNLDKADQDDKAQTRKLISALAGGAPVGGSPASPAPAAPEMPSPAPTMTAALPGGADTAPPDERLPAAAGPIPTQAVGPAPSPSVPAPDRDKIIRALGGDAGSPLSLAPPSGGSPSPSGAPAAAPPNFGNAIASIESGGRYDLMGPTTRTGDRAHGRYQVMGANIPSWTREVLGREMTPQEFLADPAAQDAVFNAKFGNYVKKYGPEGAAKAWFAGERGMNNPNAKDILGTSVAGYADKFNRAMGASRPAVGPMVAALDPNAGTMPGTGTDMPPASGLASMASAAGFGAGTDAPPQMAPAQIDQSQLPPNAAPVVGQGAPVSPPSPVPQTGPDIASAAAPVRIALASPPAGGAPASLGAAEIAAVNPMRGGMAPERRLAMISALMGTKAGAALGQHLFSEEMKKEQNTVRPMTPQERLAWQVPENMSAGIDSQGKPTFSPPQTNIALNTTQKGLEVMATKAAEDFQTAQQSAREAQKRIPIWDAMENAAKGFSPGATAELRLTAKKYLKDLGVIEGEDVPDAQVFQMLQKQLQIHSQPKGQGAVSNYERELFSQAVANINQDPAALQRAIAISRKLDQFDQQVAKVHRDSARKNGGVPNSVEINDEIDKLGSPLTPAEINFLNTRKGGGAAAGAAAAPAAAAPAPPKPAVPTPADIDAELKRRGLQ